jgi:hypothetical protein
LFDPHPFPVFDDLITTLESANWLYVGQPRKRNDAVLKFGIPFSGI